MSKKAAVYTRTGDKGTTGLYTGERVSKCSTRVESYGNLDEITSALGLARSLVKRDDVKEAIREINKQHEEERIKQFNEARELILVDEGVVAPARWILPALPLVVRNASCCA